MEDKSPKPYHHIDLRSRLLNEAIKLLDNDGIHAVTIRSIARNCEVSHAAPANHFDGRDGILDAMAAKFFVDIKENIDQSLSECANDAISRIKVLAEELLKYGLKKPNRYRLLWREYSLDDNRVIAPHSSIIYDKLILEINSLEPSKLQSVHTIAHALWSMTHGYISMRIDGNFIDNFDEITNRPRFEAMLNLFLRQI